MPDIKPVSVDFAVCGFIPPEKLADLPPRIRTVINNRPDAEEPGQPTSTEIEAEARRLGLNYVHIPVVPGQFTGEQVAAFAEAAGTGPAVAFCKSGKRAATLWALSQRGRMGADEILASAKAAGFDLAELKPRLEEKATSA